MENKNKELDDLFETLNQPEQENEVAEKMEDDNVEEVVETAVPETKVVTSGGKAKSEIDIAMKNALAKDLNEDPSIVSILGSKSDFLKVVKVLGFGDKGNFVVDKKRFDANNPKESRKLIPSSKNVGYIVENIGDEPISYTTEKWHKNEDGVWVSNEVDAVMNPGETANLTRKRLAMLASKVEFSGKLENGFITKGPQKKFPEDDGTGEAFYDMFYFMFNKDENGNSISVNDDEVKMNIGEKIGENKWVVMKEFEEDFGFCNNEVVKGGKGKRGGNKFSKQEMIAALIRQHMAEEAKGN